jgi:branched-chain amino acid transport system substrate-binding protein
LRQLGYKGLIIGGNGLNTSNLFPVCQALCDGIMIAQAYSPEHPGAINKAFRSAYQAQFKKEPPQFSAQAFTAVQVFVEALKKVDTKKSLNEIRNDVNQALLKGNYDTPIGQISFSPEGEIFQQAFYVAEVEMSPDGKTGRFEFLK